MHFLLKAPKPLGWNDQQGFSIFCSKIWCRTEKVKIYRYVSSNWNDIETYKGLQVVNSIALLGVSSFWSL